MVGMPGQDCCSAVELLGQNDAGEPVRQGHWSKRQPQLAGRERLICVPIRAANEEGHRAGPAVALLGDQVSKRLAR